MIKNKKGADPDAKDQRLFVYSLSLLFARQTKRALNVLGWRTTFGIPNKNGVIGVWGRKPAALRGLWVAQMRGSKCVTFEDAPLRSIKTGRQGEPNHGVVEDHQGIYIDTENPNDLRDIILHSDDFDESQKMDALVLMSELRRIGLSKYNDHDPDISALPDDYILVVDQTLNDASILKGGASETSFQEMLATARLENPGKTILIKTHPETATGHRMGHFSNVITDEDTVLWTRQTNPWTLFERAEKIYTVTSQMGFEAIMADHKPIVFGRPFYAGFGITDDRHSAQIVHPDREAWQLVYALYWKYSKWISRYSGMRTDVWETVDSLQARVKHRQLTRNGIVGLHMRLWKRGFLKRYLSMRHFSKDHVEAFDVARKMNASIGVWASKLNTEISSTYHGENIPILRIEDGFLRSAGLGAELVRPLSLAVDDLGIYYDPKNESRLEQMITASVLLSERSITRASKLAQSIIDGGLSKYNLGGLVLLPDSGTKEKILIPGQVEDDASIKEGTQKVSNNLALVQATRKTYPNAFLIYKPHPDVTAGLRFGGMEDKIKVLVDHVVTDGNIVDFLAQVDRVSTMTSLTGFEAILRDVPVTCFGTPFYAGWGLTHDLGVIPKRRTARPSKEALIHATLIDYPLYWDPVTQDPCPPEIIVMRFKDGNVSAGKGPAMRILSKMQGAMASFAPFWRRG
jgi:capsular polysaccharide export protein